MKDWESVSLPDMWSKLFTPEDFYNWVSQNNIRDTDWSFTTASNSFSRPVMWFKKPTDALAFKIRFGV